MRPLLFCGMMLAMVTLGGWSSPADAQWRGGVSVSIGGPAYYGYGYRGGYGWGRAPVYYGGHYATYPSHFGYVPGYVGYSGYGWGGGVPVYYGGHYHGCGW